MEWYVFWSDGAKPKSSETWQRHLCSTGDPPSSDPSINIDEYASGFPKGLPDPVLTLTQPHTAAPHEMSQGWIQEMKNYTIATYPIPEEFLSDLEVVQLKDLRSDAEILTALREHHLVSSERNI
ncbi:hypothetical protein V498_09787 [Pseudogymnoascus sp. VKM F-4517 (FW-2822)]|nr:hypothetical protein V498_09787 [Pseudogymnoascus sp. VKM F-4517 (FW-2822)]